MDMIELKHTAQILLGPKLVKRLNKLNILLQCCCNLYSITISNSISKVKHSAFRQSPRWNEICFCI